MFNLKSYFIFLSRNKLYTFVNVFGLSVSLMFVILIANYTVSEFTADNFQENADQIYVLNDGKEIGASYKIGERLSSRYPEIEKTCGVIPVEFGYPILVEIMNNKVYSTAIAVDSTFLDMFSFKLLRGDKKQALRTKHDVLISESFARKMFGNDDPIGNTIIVSDSIVYTINGVIEDFKNSMFKPADIVMLVSNMNYFNPYVIDNALNNVGSTTLFIQTAKGSNIKSKEADVLEYFKTFYWIYKTDRSYAKSKVLFTPMRDFYFNDTIEQLNWNKNSKVMLTILVLVGFLILLFAVINYINLTVAQTSFRAKEMSARRLFGASKKTILGKMIFESSFLCFIAFLLACLMAFAIEPYANNLINRDILVIENISIEWVLLSGLFVISLGLISGITPAIAISRFQPIDVVKGTFTFKSKMTFSKVFITIQSVITIILIGCSLTISKQVDYMINYDYGYNHKAIISIDRSPIDEEAFRDKLKGLPSVKSVGFTKGTPFDGGNNNTPRIVGVEEPISFQILISDSATVKMFGYKFLKDNYLADKGYWINQVALDKLGATDDLKSFKFEMNGNEVKIAGIVKGFFMGDLVLYGGSDMALMMQIDDNIKNPWTVLVEIQGNLVDGYRDVKRVFEELSDGAEFQGKYINARLKERYAEQYRIQKIMALFTIIAIIISSLGLLAISSYFIQQRSREIAVRKVFGSTRMEVLMLVIWKFMRLVVVALFIAFPIVWYVMNEWLSGFTYRIDMTIWILLLAGAFNLLVAFLTVYWQSSRVANINPTKALMK